MTPETHDPLGYETPLPLAARYYPLGFPVAIETNSPAVLALAESLWSHWPVRENPRVARLRIAVEDRACVAPLSAAFFRGQGHLVSFVQSPDNFAVADLVASFAFACLTRDVAANAEHCRYHFLEPLVYLLVDAAFLAPLHASCVALDDCAIVLCGDSGAGKTSLAYACARRGWTFLSDDATHVIRGRAGHWVSGRPFRIRFRETARDLFPELRSFIPHMRPNGKLDIEVETRDLDLRVATEARASHIVFLRRTADGTPARFEPCPAADAARRLHQTICYGSPETRAEQRRTLDSFLTLPVLTLTYSDLQSAEEVLRGLVTASS